MAHKTKNENDICGGLERGPGERDTVARATTTGAFAGGHGGTIDVGYSDSDAISLVNLGETNRDMMGRVPLDKLTPLYGGAGPSTHAGNVSPREGAGPDRSYRNPRGR